MRKNRTENPNIASERIVVLEKGEIFVFGSNLAGRNMGVQPGLLPDTFRRWYESIDYTNTRIKNNEPRNVSLNHYNPLLISAILGDIAGSIYEFCPHKNTDIVLQDSRIDYTDDTIMTIAVTDWILNDKKLTKKGLVTRMQAWGRKYPHRMGAYGNMFSAWLHADHPKPYNSWGNGAAMRVAGKIGVCCYTI